jgi:Cu(I)/Ag(I) efflux system membrane fusion protein/cobalt-zinc-cadmium efflux system membrane fusion protein
MRCACNRPARRFCLILFASALLASCGGGQGGASVPAGQVLQPSGPADGLVVSFATQPEPPEKGENTVQVTVTRADGSPVTDATVAAVFSMPAMPSMNMPAMRSDAALRHEGEGRYRGTGQLSMGGTWNVAITVTQASQELATRRLSIVAKE